MQQSLKVLIVEDELLLLMQLEAFLKDAGHVVVGNAVSSREAISLSGKVEADLALVDINLMDGPTGVEVGRYIAEHTGAVVIFMTANPKRIPEDFSGAIGVISKPYTRVGVTSALNYLLEAVCNPPPMNALPRSLVLSPTYARKWAHSA